MCCLPVWTGLTEALYQGERDWVGVGEAVGICRKNRSRRLHDRASAAPLIIPGVWWAHRSNSKWAHTKKRAILKDGTVEDLWHSTDSQCWPPPNCSCGTSRHTLSICAPMPCSQPELETVLWLLYILIGSAGCPRELGTTDPASEPWIPIFLMRPTKSAYWD